MLLTFIVMKVFGIDANIMALTGIAIAIGVMVDMAVILCENILRHMEEDPEEKNLFKIVHEATSEVGGAVITSSLLTIISFLPVFTLTGPEGKLFKPVAYTKTFAMAASLVLALIVIPPVAHMLFQPRNLRRNTLLVFNGAITLLGIWLGFKISWWLGVPVAFVGVFKLVALFLPPDL